MLEVTCVRQSPSDVEDSAMDPALEALKSFTELERFEARLMDHLGSLLATSEDMPRAQWRPSPYHENEQQIYPSSVPSRGRHPRCTSTTTLCEDKTPWVLGPTTPGAECRHARHQCHTGMTQEHHPWFNFLDVNVQHRMLDMPRRLLQNVITEIQLWMLVIQQEWSSDRPGVPWQKEADFLICIVHSVFTCQHVHVTHQLTCCHTAWASKQ